MQSPDVAQPNFDAIIASILENDSADRTCTKCDKGGRVKVYRKVKVVPKIARANH